MTKTYTEIKLNKYAYSFLENQRKYEDDGQHREMIVYSEISGTKSI